MSELKEDFVNHPAHYQSECGLEVIDIIRAFVPNVESYYMGNVIKYILRSGKKNGLEDLQKAEVYLKWWIAEESTK